jgi:hypothetical protein
MIQTRRRLIAALAASLLVAACTEVPPEPSPPGSASPSVPAPTPGASASVAPSASPDASAPASAGPTTETACAILTETGRLPSDRMTDVVITRRTARTS